MVSIVIVSHSAALAAGVAELAREMAGAEVTIEAVGGTEGGTATGTDAVAVTEALQRADSPDGTVVLMDLGSAVLSTEMALDMLDPDLRERVILSDGPLVEGAVGAATAARLGQSTAEVAAEARRGLDPKRAHLDEADEESGGLDAGRDQRPAHEVRITVRNKLGLHARPAALFVRTAGGFDAEITVTNVSKGRGPTPGSSLSGVATLQVSQGDELIVEGRGPAASDALRALEELAATGFGEEVGESGPAPSATQAPSQPGEGQLAGIAVSPGVALGPVRTFRRAELVIPDHRASDSDEEWARLERAIEDTKTGISETRDVVAGKAGEDEAAIFDAHLLMVDDVMLMDAAKSAIFEREANAARAYADAVDDAVAQYRQLTDEYLAARADDVADVGRQVVARLVGAEDAQPDLDEPGVLVARDLTPADTAGLDPALVRGIATAIGGPTSHSAILARSLGVPAVAGLGDDLLELGDGTIVLLDGDAGTVTLDPDEEATAEYERRVAARSAIEKEARAAAMEPAVTSDGRVVEIGGNAGSAGDARAIVAAGGEGIGLLRTEFLYLDRDEAPAEAEQVEAYSAVAGALEGRPLILRTLDAGGDKPLRFAEHPDEANPFLGLRGLRLGFKQPDLLRVQLRAVARVAASHDVRVMFPMVTNVAEVRAVKDIFDEVMSELADEGMEASRPQLGIMIEVPGAALTAPALAAEVEFFSIGTNDLTQYTLAVDRDNDGVARLADTSHPAVLRLIDLVVRGAALHDRFVGVCGEAAADPYVVPLLVGLGVDELSMNANAIPLAKREVRMLSFSEAKAVAEAALNLDSAAAVRAMVADRFGRAVGVSDSQRQPLREG